MRNLTLTRARVPDGNGAGIRAEGRNLLVERVRFIDNQNGILAADQPEGELIVRDSEFVRNGTCEQACAHGIYATGLPSCASSDRRSAKHARVITSSPGPLEPRYWAAT